MERTITTRAVLQISTTPGATGWGGVAGQPETPTGLLDLITPLLTDSGTIDYIRETTDLTVNQANAVAEGALKPEHAPGFTVEQATPETIAVWTAASRQWIADMPGRQEYVVDRLRGLIRARLSAKAATAITGAPGILTPAAASIVERMVRTVTALRTAGYNPTGLAINPADQADVALDTDSTGAWLALPPGLVLPRIVTDPAITRGKVLAFDAAAVRLLIREETSLLMADQHADLFLRNQVILLAETRAVTVVMQPKGVAVATIPALP